MNTSSASTAAFRKSLLRIFNKVSIYDGEAVYLAHIAKHPPYLAELLAVYWLNAEVSNGGFHQFFSNSTGVVAPEAVAGLRNMGETKLHALAVRAVATLGRAYSRDRYDRYVKLQALGKAKGRKKDPLNAIDLEWYAANDGLEASMERYFLASHPPRRKPSPARGKRNKP